MPFKATDSLNIGLARRLGLNLVFLFFFNSFAYSQISLDSFFTKVEDYRLAAQVDSSLFLLESIKEQAQKANRLPEWQIWKAKCLSDTDAAAEAIDLLERAERSLDLPKDDLLLAEAQNIKGAIALRQNNLPEAEQLYEDALGIRETYLGPANEKVADSHNNLGVVYFLQQRYEAAIFQHQQALTIRLEVLPKLHPDLASSYNNIAACYYDLGQIEAATTYNEKALDQRLGSFGENHPTVADSYNNLGNCYFDLYQLDSAMQYHEKALHIRRELGLEAGQAASYNNLGNCWLERGDYNQAIQYFGQAIQLYEQVYGSNHPAIAEVAVNQGNAYLEIGDFSNAFNRFRLARFIIESTFGTEAPNRIPTILGQASALQQMGNFEAAIPLYSLAIEQLKAQLGNDHPLLPDAFNNLGNCFFLQDDYTSARAYYQQALQAYQQQNRLVKDKASSIFNIGNTFLEENKPQKALNYYREAHSLLEQKHSFSSLFLKVKLAMATAYAQMGDPAAARAVLEEEVNKIENSASTPRPSWIDVLVQLADLYQQDANADDWQKALFYYEQAIDLLDQLLIYNRSMVAKRRIRLDYFRLYEKGIQCALQLSEGMQKEQYLEKAFQISERSKALLIREASNESEARTFSNVPDSLLETEANLRQQIAEYEQVLYEQADQLDSTSTRLVELELLNLRGSYNQLVADLERTYPDYFRKKYQTEVVPLAKVYSNLEAGEGVLSYFLGDSTAFAFLLTPEGLQVSSLDRTELELRTIQLWDAISHFTGAQAASDYTIYANQYASNAYQLYQQLFAPVDEDGGLPSRLTVIPDGILCYLPFDLLLKTPVDSSALFRFGQHAYLIRDYQFSYAYSVGQWAKAQEDRGTRKRVFWSGFAPNFSKEKSDFEPLFYNEAEIRNIGKIIPGDHLFIGQAATLDAFEAQARRAGIIHLATHGLANANRSDFAFLAFSAKDSTNQLLYTQNLYAMDLHQVELVVLSACETGLGEALPGEGVISLAHAFRYAGAKSIITTLWSIDDEQTANIMLDFYRNLKKGQTKDEALRNARLHYLEESNGEYAHPYFWAAFVPIGEMAPVVFSKNVTYLIIFGVFILFLMLFIFFRKK